MHLLYLDASGDSGWPPPYGKSRTNWYVLSALSLEESLWKKADEGVRDVLTNHGLQWLTNFRELRLSTILAGATPYDKMGRTQRSKLIDDVFNLVLSLKPVLFYSAIDKAKHKSQYLDIALSPHVWALQLICPRFHKYLLRVDGYGILVMDPEETRKDAKLKELIKNAKQQGIVLKSSFNPFLSDTQLPRLIESVLFVDSHDSPGIQLADFCSHAIWKYYERGMRYRYNQISKLLDSHGGNVYGSIVWPRQHKEGKGSRH